MRFWLLAPLLFVLAGCTRDERGASKVTAATASTWEKDVLSAPGPVLVDFGASWCPPCREMDPIVASLSKEFQVRKIDVDSEPELARMYKVSSIPRLLIFVDGKIARDHKGFTRESILRSDLQELSRK